LQDCFELIHGRLLVGYGSGSQHMDFGRHGTTSKEGNASTQHIVYENWRLGNLSKVLCLF
jgi:hypothetical protein